MVVCTGCAKHALITIRMRVGGREIVFHRCAKCEANTWQDDGGDAQPRRGARARPRRPLISRERSQRAASGR